MLDYWNAFDADDHALCYVAKRLEGQNLIIPPSVDLELTRAEIINEGFLIPIGLRLSALFGSGLTYKSLRRLVRNDSGPGVIRTILLWILGRWNSDRPRVCCNCGIIFQSQSRVVNCTDLTSQMLSVIPEPDLELLSTPESIIGFVLELSCSAQRALLPMVESFIHAAIGSIFGDRILIT